MNILKHIFKSEIEKYNAKQQILNNNLNTYFKNDTFLFSRFFCFRYFFTNDIKKKLMWIYAYENVFDFS